MRLTRILAAVALATTLTGCISSLYEVKPDRPYVVVDQQTYRVAHPCRPWR